MSKLISSSNLLQTIVPFTRLLNFKCSKSCQELKVKVVEVLDPSYGMYVWPCAPVLAQFVWFHRDKISGKHILELGAGTSLPGVVAALLHGNVTLSDATHLPHCCDNCLQNVRANGLKDKVQVVGVTWGLFEPDLLELPPVDIILASDCFYDTKDFEDVMMTVVYLLDKNTNAELWTTYQERSSDRSLEPLLQKWGLTCTHIPLENFEADSPDLADSNLPGNHTIQMMIIRKGTG